MSFYNQVIKNMVLPLSDLALGRSLARHMRFVEESQWWSPEQLREFQNEKLRDLIRHAYTNVPYYRQVFDERRLKPEDIKTTDDLVKLPILTKEIIKKNLPEKLLARGIPKRQIMFACSSGSTGEPLQYYTTKDAYSFNIACGLRAWSWTGFRLGDKYLKISQNPRKGFLNKLQDFVQRCDYVHSQSLTPAGIADIVEKIRSSRAKLLRGYPSTLYVLAGYVRDNQIDDIRPKAVTTTGEILFAHMRELIEKQFHCRIFDAYSGECGANVSECETHEVYHISAEYAFTELIADGRRVENEGKGEVVSTNFWNYAVPFIRYNVKDVAVLTGKKCSCKRGLPVLESIQGRDSDILVTPSGKHLIVHFFTGYFEYIDSVEQFQVLQNKPDQITLLMIPNEKFDKDTENKIHKDVTKYIGDDVKLQIKIVDDIALTRSGKRRFMIRNFPYEF